MQHEALAILAFERVDDWFIGPGAQSGNAECLGFAAGEQGRAVRAG